MGTPRRDPILARKPSGGGLNGAGDAGGSVRRELSRAPLPPVADGVKQEG